MCKFIENTGVAFLIVSEHKEWMSTIHGFSGCLAIFEWSTLVLAPNSIDTVLIEEVLTGTFSQSEDTLEIVTAGDSHLGVYLVEIGV